MGLILLNALIDSLPISEIRHLKGFGAAVKQKKTAE
jgi:hypothetical protein